MKKQPNDSEKQQPAILITKEILKQDKSLLVLRHETSEDERAVENLTRLAFWNLYMPGCDEHYLVHTLRNHPDYLPELSFIAQINDTIVGCIMYTKSHVVVTDGDDEEPNSSTTIPTVTFGPLCVRPEYQRLGIGRRLIDHSLEIAASMGYPAVIILGHPTNYCRYGFVNCRDWNIANSTGRYPYGQLIKVLNEDNCPFQKQQHQEKDPESVGPRKKFQYHFSSAFQEIDPKKVEAFDASFPRMEKKEKYSQVEFGIAFRAYLD